MDILIIYSSRTGNTQKLAEYIGEGVKKADNSIGLKVLDVKLITDQDLIEADAIIIGSPVYYGLMSASIKNMFDKSNPIRGKLKDKVGAAFATSAHHTGGKETTILSILQAMLIHNMIVISDPLSTGGHYGLACTGKPGNKEKNEAFLFAKRIVDVTKKIKKS